ncbi:MAG: type I restriction enzyme HsdR N-terminal domain-containing protein [Methanothrix sp.]|nr:type I restriction enzyme HsdR N-terminal domain-containing protein [Methanothrix sp.]
MIPSKSVADRIKRSVAKFQPVLRAARDRDVNESDTSGIVKDMLAELFGYEKYQEVTSELAIRGTFCDLAIRVDNKIEFLIEVKAIGTTLKESHLRQARDYGANNGVPWVILTNGMMWRVFKIRFEQPISYDLVCDLDFSSIEGKLEGDQEKVFIICKEGISKDAREQFYEKTRSLNRFVLGALVMSDEVVSVIRRELKKVSDGFLVAPEDIKKVLENDVLKRDVIEGEEAQKAQSRLKRFYRKASKENVEDAAPEIQTPPEQTKDG